MKIFVASDTFKETLSSEEIGRILQEELENHEVAYLSVSDGGEGLLAVFEQSMSEVTVSTADPLGRTIEAKYLIKDQTAVIESASACGLGLLTEEERNPLLTSTYGVGLMIKDAIARGAKHIMVGIGGSSTNDGGTGMLAALGARFFDDEHELLQMKGQTLSHIRTIDLTPCQQLTKDIRIEVACDVDNPLLGPKGATMTYGQQKGATPDQLILLEEGMVHYRNCLEQTLGRMTSHPGDGAAGGLGFAFSTCLGQVLKPGIEVVLDYLFFDTVIADYDLIITGEGKIDHQSLHGKVISGVMNRASLLAKPCIAVCGTKEISLEGCLNVFSIVPKHTTFKEAMNAPEEAFRKMIRCELLPWLSSFKIE